MKFKDIYLGYIGEVFGFDPVTANHIVSQSSKYDLYNANGENLITKEKYPVCHQSTTPIEKGKKGVTLSKASSLFSINPEAELDEEAIKYFRKLIQEKYIFSLVNQQYISKTLSNKLKSKTTSTKQENKNNQDEEKTIIF